MCFQMSYSGHIVLCFDLKSTAELLIMLAWIGHNLAQIFIGRQLISKGWTENHPIS